VIKKKKAVNSSSDEDYNNIAEQDDEDEVMSSSYKKGGGRGSRSRSRSDHSSTRGGAPALTKNLKKRKHEEISTETAHHAPA